MLEQFADGMHVFKSLVDMSCSIAWSLVTWGAGTVCYFCILRAFSIGRQAVALERPFAALVAQGIALWLGVQTLINMGVNMGVLPTKGLTLPLMSFGGSGILANCAALAILMRIDYENRAMMRGQTA